MERARIVAAFPGQVLRLHAKPGDRLSRGAELVSIRMKSPAALGSSQSVASVQAFRSYTVRELPLAIGQQVSKGDVIAEVEYCTHPTAFKNLCAICGESVEESNGHLEHSVVVAGGQNLSMNASEMQTMGKFQHDALKAQRKLALIIDLDHTVLHATAAPRQCDIEQFQDTIHNIEVNERGRRETYTIKLRPGLQEFFNQLAPLYRITIYTHGTRPYAESVAHVLDPKGMLFGQRIVSRTDTPNLQTSKSLRKIFPSDPSMALIIDDRDDVWEGPQSMHLLLVRPYTYFKSAPEVNNVSGQKTLTQAASHNNEQRADEPAVEETDGYLLHVAKILKGVHREYYSRFDQLQAAPEPLPDVRADAALILQQRYQKTLQNVRVLFSALIPTSDRDPSKHQLWRYAEKLGATVVGSVAEATHLVAANTQTEKARQAIAAGDVFVVHADWLLHCLWRLQRVDERRFLLAEAPKSPKMPFGSESAPVDEDEKEEAKEENSSVVAPAASSRPQPQTPTPSAVMDDTAKAESETGEAGAAAKPKRLKLLKRRKTENAQAEAGSTSSAASSAARASVSAREEAKREVHIVDLYVHPDGSHTLTPEPPAAGFGDSTDTITLQQDYEEAAKIAQQVEELGRRAAAAKEPDPATTLLDVPEEPGPVDDPEAFPEERVRRRSIDYTNDRIIANDFEYAEWPSELVDYYQSVGKGAGGHIDDHEPIPEPPVEDENDYQEVFDKQFADEDSEGYLLAERTEAPDPSDPEQMLRGDGTDVRFRAARGTSSPRKRDRNFPDVPAETAKRTRHVATESPESSDDAETDEWVNQMEEEIRNSTMP